MIFKMVCCIPEILTFLLTTKLTYVYKCENLDDIHVIYVIYVKYDMYGAMTYTI